jgi:hypothetical protein
VGSLNLKRKKLSEKIYPMILDLPRGGYLTLKFLDAAARLIPQPSSPLPQNSVKGGNTKL